MEQFVGGAAARAARDTMHEGYGVLCVYVAVGVQIEFGGQDVEN